MTLETEPSQRWTITSGTGGSVVTHASGLNSSVVVDWDNIVPDGTGTIAFTLDTTAAQDDVALALNFGEITLVPEPSTLVLATVGLFGLLGFGRRRKR
jgi:hypothetical protein